MKRQVNVKLEERLLADAQGAVRQRGLTFTGYVKGLIEADLYGDEEPSEQWATMQQMADMQESFDDHERRLAELEERAREAY